MNGWFRHQSWLERTSGPAMNSGDGSWLTEWGRNWRICLCTSLMMMLPGHGLQIELSSSWRGTLMPPERYGHFSDLKLNQILFVFHFTCFWIQYSSWCFEIGFYFQEPVKDTTEFNRYIPPMRPNPLKVTSQVNMTAAWSSAGICRKFLGLRFCL